MVPKFTHLLMKNEKCLLKLSYLPTSQDVRLIYSTQVIVLESQLFNNISPESFAEKLRFTLHSYAGLFSQFLLTFLLSSTESFFKFYTYLIKKNSYQHANTFHWSISDLKFKPKRMIAQFEEGYLQSLLKQLCVLRI